LSVGATVMKTAIDPALIAPCGMNCALCSGYLALKNDVKNKGIRLINCLGCRPRNKKCAFLKGHCSKLSKGEVAFCFECASFPCGRLRTIDNRYRSRYRMSMIENLNFIKENGIEKFLEDQEETWKCQNCGELISCHNGLCFNCDLKKLKNKKQKYRWNEP
jgi:hypothetical protein